LFNFNLKIEGNILEYLKTKNLLIYLSTKNSRMDNLENSFSSNELNEDGNDMLQIGVCKVPLCEMLSMFDKITNDYPIFSINDSSVVLGYISLDLALENGSEEIQEVDKQVKKSKRDRSSKKKSTFSDILLNKKQETLDGKFYFNVKILHLIYTDNFLKKLEKQLKLNPQIKERNIYFMYKIGNSIKKVSHIYDLSEYDCRNFEFFNYLSVFFNEIIELSFYFSSKIVLIEGISLKT
jgi:hypothetical protein